LPATPDAAQLPKEHRPLPKTHLSSKELQEFSGLLLDKRAQLAGDVKRLTNEALNSKGPEHSEHSAMPIHMADAGSDNWEQEFTLGLLANEQALIREIDEALARIENKTYGICLAMRKKISKARLRAKPWAKYCIEYAQALENGRAV
jgi:RNA polymerase-binding transcription factor DksA